ncbi:glycosyltransferase [Cetobacterium sp.]|uniref:glycosyltransferase n=1 Tax=Cetobacterium sp. TaxID=2071632 RepID=UPI003F3C5B72
MKNLVIRSGSLRMGGLERVLIEVLQNLDQMKYNISLIIEDNSGDENIFLDEVPKWIDVYFLKPEELIQKTYYHRKRKKNIYNKIMYNILMAKEHSFVTKRTVEVLKEIELKYGDVDVFLDYDWGARRYVEKLKAKKKLVWIHNSVPKLLKKKSKIVRFGKNLMKYDKVVAICDDMKKELEEIYPYLIGKVERVYNPFNFKRILDLSEDKSDLSREDKKLLEDDYIVAVSRLDTVQKDYFTLIKGYKLALEGGIKEKLYIVGDGPDRKEIEELIVENNLEGNIKLLGKRKNPYLWMKNSKLFVHSSKYEGLPTVLIEAMICSKIIISSDCPTGPAEILKGGHAGALFKVGDYNKLGSILENILKDPIQIKNYNKIMEKRVLEFKSDFVIKEYEELINEKSYFNNK